MLVHVFQASKSSLHGLACDSSGACLPQDPNLGEWRHVRDVELKPGEQRLAIDSDDAISDISERGYHLLAGLYPRL